MFFFSRIFWLGQTIENDVNSKDMLCNKISENPRTNYHFDDFQDNREICKDFIRT